MHPKLGGEDLDMANAHDVLLVGSGPMAAEHARALLALERKPVVIGRGQTSAAVFSERTGVEVVPGGVEATLPRLAELPEAAVVAVGVDALAPVAHLLIERGVRRLLVEKPAGLDRAEIAGLAAAAEASGARVLVAYNRRFYASVRAARELIRDDGGVTSFAFEFTERSHIVEALPTPAAIKRQWFLANSTHVIDLAFFLGGEPRTLAAYAEGGLAWHPAGSRFAGAGVTAGGAVFGYSADWDGPGGWGVELVTARRRLVLRPLERLRVSERGSPEPAEHPLDGDADAGLKPGVFRQMEAFLSGDPDLLDIGRHLERLDRVLLPMRDGTPVA